MANPVVDSEKQFNAGLSLQKVEDFDAAIAAYRASVDLHPTRSALFNLANCLRATHRYPEALTILERLNAEYGPLLDEPMRLAVEGQTAELSNLTATLVVEVVAQAGTSGTGSGAPVVGAQISINDVPVGRTPLAGPIRLGLGSHALGVSHPDYAPVVVELALIGGSESIERVVLRTARASSADGAPSAEAAPPTAAEAETRPGSSSEVFRSASRPVVSDAGAGSGVLATAGWITAGAGAALLAGGAVTGLLALSVDGELEQVCVAGRCPLDRRHDVERLETLTTTTNVLWGMGLAAGVVGVTLVLLDAEPAAPPVVLSLAPGFVGLGARQVF
jgi:hypothetical protein